MRVAAAAGTLTTRVVVSNELAGIDFLALAHVLAYAPHGLAATQGALRDRADMPCGGQHRPSTSGPQQWVLIELPATEAEPSEYILSTLPEETPITEMVSVACQPCASSAITRI